MATTVHANGKGDGAGTHVRESAPILKGKYDTQLKWPFIGKITVTLLNQLEDKNHHQDTLKQTATKKCTSWKCMGLVTVHPSLCTGL